MIDSECWFLKNIYFSNSKEKYTIKMKGEKDNKGITPKEEITENNILPRRTLLKALLGLPVLGLFTWEFLQKKSFDEQKKSKLVTDLGLDEIQALYVIKSSPMTGSKLLRIGMIGIGNRGQDLAKSLGFIHPDRLEDMKKDNTLENYLLQENLNVAVTGICDVFDLHAERALDIARNEIRPGGVSGSALPVKRYLRYQEMLDDKDIDAVIVATPDHHHAIISAAAVKAGKHVYCEKSVAMNEEELNALYQAVKNSNCVYQLGHQIPQNVIFRQAREIINKDILGKITHIETTSNRNSADGAWIRHLDKNGNPKPGDEKSIDWDQWLGTKPKVPFNIERYYNWTKYFDYDTGLIGQLFSHEFDAVNQLLRIGIPKSVMASGGIYYWKDGRDMADVLNVVFEYPEKELTLTYSGNLASSKDRGRVIMGKEAYMELGASLKITADSESLRYKKQMEDGIIPTSGPMLYIKPGASKVDAITSATARYYAERGLDKTFIDGREVDIVHLHLKEWLDCIRNGGTPSANIDRAFEEGVACVMAHKSYVEKRRVEWDPVDRKIV
jgi:predicted dehydrogenase